jgi:hypothetical protein
MCMTQLRQKKERLQFLEVKNFELMELLNERSWKKMKNRRCIGWCSTNYKMGFTKIVVDRVSLMVFVLRQTFPTL